MAAKKKTKKTSTKKSAAKQKPAARKTVTKKSTTRKKAASAAKKTAAKKTSAKSTTTKKAPAKKTPAKKTPAKKTPAKKTSAKAAPKQTPPLVVDHETTTTTIVARIDTGFGNAVFLRGSGAGLTWSRGERMRCENASEWRFTLENVEDDFEAKLLLNDDRWAEGDNFVVAAGETVILEPDF